MVQRCLGCVLLSSFLFACHPPKPLPPPKYVPPIGSRVELAAGDVWLEMDNRKQRVIQGDMLAENAEISSDAGARALVRLTDGTGIFLRDHTELSLVNGGVELKQGEIWVDVPAHERELKRFRVGGTVVTASGAGFDIAYKNGKIQVYVARGLAIVESKGGRAEVESGEKALLETKDAKPEVKPVKFFVDWTGGMADQGLSTDVSGRATGRIYGIDRQRPGSLPTELDIRSQDIFIVIRDGIAHTTVDQRFFNPASTDVEGWYWFTIPEGASVERFALDVNGVLIEGEMTERKRAAEAYEEAVQRAVDPALLEWVDGRNFRARIFPVPAAGERRVVLSYTQLLPFADGTYRYVYPMGGAGEKRIQEFSLQVDLGDDGDDYEIATLQDARVSEDGNLISIRRSGYLPKADFLLELNQTKKIPPLRAYRFSTDGREADYLMIRYAPEEDFSTVKEVPGDVVIVVDTSAGGGETERQIRVDAAVAILSALSDEDRFAIVSADLSPRVVYPESGLSPATDTHVSKATETLSEAASAGATDLGEMFHVAFDLVHDAIQPAVVYIGDGRPTVGETDALSLTERLRRSLGDSRARLFTLAVGEAADHALLKRLSRMGGGRAFRIDTPEQSVQEALLFAGVVKTPTITDLHIDLGAGLDQPFSTVAGKVSEGEEAVILARSHHELPNQIVVKGRLGGKLFERRYDTNEVSGREYGYIPPLWARMYLERLMGDGLETNRGAIISLGLSYYLMTPFTSFLVLDSHEAYAAAGIPRRGDAGHFWNGFRDTQLPGPGLKTPSDGVNDLYDVSDGESDIMLKKERVEQPAAEMEAAPEPMPAPQPAAKASRPRSKTRSRAGTKSVASSPRPKPSRRSRSSSPKKSAAGPDVFDMVEDAEKKRSVAASPVRKQRSRNRDMRAKGICSDAARRPLHQRRVIWIRKLDRAKTPADWADLFFDAASRCELPRMRAKKSMLSLIEARAHTADEISAVLREFGGHPKLQRYLKRRIIRRTLSTDISVNLYEPSSINWYAVRRGLGALETAEARLKKVQDMLENYPDDTAGRILLVDALIEVGQTEDALATALKLKRDGLAGTDLLETICDLQAKKDESEAQRTCSELVEFSEADPTARQRLGDLFLRHGWFEAAYRQYKTLVALQTERPEAHLRLAIAAAGMGRVDEALRIERKVSTFDGEEGPQDPRRFARLHSAARLARMISELNRDDADVKEQRAMLQRGLKRTGLFTEPTTIVILTWRDLSVPLTLRALNGKKPVTATDDANARQSGLKMVNYGRRNLEELTMEVHIEQAPIRRDVSFSVTIIAFDGADFRIDARTGSLPARTQHVAL